MDELTQQRDDKLSDIHRQEEESACERQAQKLGLNYINLAHVPVERDSLHFIPQTDAERTRTVVIQKKGQVLKIGAVDPANEETKQIIAMLKSQGFNIDVFMISLSSFKKALDEFKFIPSQLKGASTSGEISLEKIESLKKELATFADLKTKLTQIDQANTSALLEIFLSAALTLEVSDIHIEPQANQTQIRFRLDGVLQDAGVIIKTVYESVLSRTKLLSGLRLNVQNVPQDGRFTIKQMGEMGEKGVEVEVRVSILPGAYGEYIVLRILNPNTIKLDIKDLGFRDYLWQKLEPEIKKPSGIILVTGPTGSGKTTTLYAFLKHLNQPGIKIVTLEDPIEYHLQGIDQSQVAPEKGYTFAQGLRSILRQDPNIILVGEIRDEETADVALHAALTGHLVFSTLHTNDAIGAIPRFLDLNAKPKILASALNAVIGQRLVRKLCLSCKTPATGVDIEKIKKDLAGVPENILPKEISVFKNVGCAKCGHSGYKGRIGVYEIVFVSDSLEELVGTNPSHQDILAEAKKNGFITMYQDGLMRVLVGETTLEEIARVTSSNV
ncbi:MAG: GspE/PulE family protein [bacterium]|nr:GspE/PulE family protein [bacterium]